MLSLHPAFEEYGRLAVQFHAFLTSATDGGEQIASRLGFITRGRNPRFPLNERLHVPSNQYSRFGEAGNFWILSADA